MVICHVSQITDAKERQPDVYEVDRTDHFDGKIYKIKKRVLKFKERSKNWFLKSNYI